MPGGPEREHPPKPGQTELPATRGDITPRAPLMQEYQSWDNVPHEELVRGFRDLLNQRIQKLPPAERDSYVLEEIIYRELSRHLAPQEGLDDPNRIKEREAREAFFIPIIHAWDALAYERYETGPGLEEMAGFELWQNYGAFQEPIKLTDPLQVRILDALAEVAGIPHQREQTDIEIPEKLRGGYLKYQESQEYKERLAQAQAKRYGGGSAR